MAELSLLRAMLQGEMAVATVSASGLNGEQLFTNDVYRMVAQGLLSAYAEHSKPDIALMLSAFTPEEAQQISGALETEAAMADPEKLANDSILRIRLLDAEEEIKDLREKSTGETIPLEEKLSLTRRIAELDNMRRKLRVQQ